MTEVFRNGWALRDAEIVQTKRHLSERMQQHFPKRGLNAAAELSLSRTPSCFCGYGKATLGPYGYDLSITTFFAC